MRLRLSSLKEGSQTIEFALGKDDLSITDIPFLQPVAVKLNIYKGQYQITVKGNLQTALELECDRCLESYKFDVKTNFQAIISPVKSISSEIDENVIPITSKTDEVDLTPFARDALILEIPMKKICSESCKGICAGCGTNLNKNTCRCSSVHIDDRLAPLKDLLTNSMEE
ncbi:MAG: DUF177 domain-containing protein [Candidatus Marinimicrobia bacterium]|nr:DUF177 domain-containing protein [Candidatus Neomarinimicrobiota bacterium]